MDCLRVNVPLFIMIPTDRKAIALAMVAVLCWSTVATAFKIALTHQSLYQLLFMANLTTVFALLPILAWQKQLIRAIRTIPKYFRSVFILAAINPVLYYLILFRAYELLPAQVAQPINYTWAITLSLLSVPFLGHKFTRRDAIAMAIAYSGVVLISLGGKASGIPVTISGIALALFSTLLWAGYWILNTKDQRDPVTAIFQNFLIALPLTGLVFWIMDGQFNSSWQSLSSGIYVGLFEMGWTFVFWLSALRLASRASLISNLIFISPFVSLILINQILGETIGQLTIVGLAAIVAALLYQNKK